MRATSDCVVCGADYREAAAAIAKRRLAEHIREKARTDERHAEWVDRHTENGSIGEIRTALGRDG
jgi:hypothetical protein